MILFCLPHAGANGFSYYKWKTLLDPRFKFITIDLPGHRAGERGNYVDKFDVALRDVYSQIVDVLKRENDDYIIFGHSLGGLMTYELYYVLAESGQRLPWKIYISGRIPPTVEYKDDLSERLIGMDEARGYLKTNGLSAMDDKKDADFINYYGELLLADMRLMDSYKYVPHQEPVLTDTMILFGGEDYSTPFRDIKCWGHLCKGHLTYVKIVGGHLFPLETAKDVVQLFNRDMEVYLER